MWLLLLDRDLLQSAHGYSDTSQLIQGGAPPLTTKNEAPAPKFYKTEAPEWQF